nr:protein early flowering 3-like [Tanacetum cinerariifolium]
MATRLDSYHSSGINLNISLTTVKQTIETTKCQTLCNTGQLKRGDYSLFKPQDFRSTRNSSIKKIEVEDDYLLPSLSFGTHLHDAKHITSCQKQLKLTDKETTQENNLHSTTIKDIDEEPMTRYSDRVRYSEMLSRELSPPNSRKRSLSIDEPHMLHDPNFRLPLKRKSYQENMVYNYKDGTKNMSTSICPLLGDNGKVDRCTNEVITSINKCHEDHPSLNLEDSEKIGDALEINNVSGYSYITPEEVSEVIGPEEYRRARRVIIQQQREFQSQLFELHRLIK